MMKIYFILVIGFFAFPQFTISQDCSGSLGEPVFFEDFGVAGSQYGPPLPAGQTTYDYVATNNVLDGQYTITSSPRLALNPFFDTVDNTPNDTDGYMLVVNASFDADEFYRRRVTGLCENTLFEFSAFILNVLPGPAEVDPDVRFEIRSIDGALLGTTNTGRIAPTTTPVWERHAILFNTDTFTEVDLIMINNADGGIGNDLAIDDISFSACGDLANITNQPQDLVFCSNALPSQVILDSALTGNEFDTPVFQWQIFSGGSFNDLPGETSDMLTISPITESATYRFKVADSPANLANDSCSILSNESDIVIVDLSNIEVIGETTLCDNESIDLSVTGAAFDGVIWTLPDGTTRTVENLVESNPIAGEYIANVSVGNCSTSQPFTVTLEESSESTELISECIDTEITLADGSLYRFIEDDNFSLTVPRATNGCDSLINYEIEVLLVGCISESTCRIGFPSGLTPNGDEINEEFKPLFFDQCVYENYTLAVYNRWGNQLFETNDLNEFWRPEDDQSQVYLWHASYDIILENGEAVPIEDSQIVYVLT